MAADSLGEIGPRNELVRRALIQVLETTKDEDTRWTVAYNLRKTTVGNDLAIQDLIQVLETTEDEDTRKWVAYIFWDIAIGNELAIRALIQVLGSSKDEDAGSTVAECLGDIAVGNELAIRALIQVLETTEDEYTRRWVAESLRKIDPENELAIRALIQVLETTENEDTRSTVAYSLGEIIVENELAIRALIQVLETTEDEYTRRTFAERLGEIAVGNELVIQELIRALKTTQDKYIRWSFVYSLGKIIQTEKQYADVVSALKHDLTNEVYKNNFDRFESCYDLLWQCAQNLPYPKFYQAWYLNTLTPHPEMTNNTPVEVLPTVRKLEQQNTDISTQLSHLPVHCINVNKLLTLNIKNEIVQAFCNRLYRKLLPNETIPSVQTVTDLEKEIIHLKQQLETPHLFILLLADGTPTPEVIDYCDYLTEVLHLGWITPDPLPLPPPQRSFVASQKNLLEAVESWVAEY